MKKTIISATFTLLVSFAQSANQTESDTSKAAFYSAFDSLKNMLEGMDSLNYEKAIFITENAYYDNFLNYEEFNLIIDYHTKNIKVLAENAKRANKEKYKSLKLYEQKMFNLNTSNWAIFNYLTDTNVILYYDHIHYQEPLNYSNADPYGSNQWENTQITNLLLNKNKQGNCYVLSILFKIFSDRLESEARLVTTPHHIYIQTRNERGDFKNVELATKSFPGDGSIQVLSYTTKETIMRGMAQQPLDDKQAIVLNLIYLAKGFQHKFNDNTDDFLLQCADLVIKHDSLSMNALLLKAEITENKLFERLKENKISTVAQARTNPKTKTLLASYEKQLSNLYKHGYREIPKDIQHIILSAMQGNKDGYITTDKTPNPFAVIGEKQRYATLSWGLFDEMHYPVDTIQYFHASLNTKKNKIIEFLPVDTSKHYKVDPVVFALSVDPHFKKYPGLSPYAFVANNPINYIDPDGRDIVILNDPTGAKTAGHQAVLISDGKGGWNYVSKDAYKGLPVGGKPVITVERFESIEAFANSIHNVQRDDDGNIILDESRNKIQRYTQGYLIKTDPKTDPASFEAAVKEAQETYNLGFSDCSHVCTEALEAAKTAEGKNVNSGETNPTVIIPGTKYTPAVISPDYNFTPNEKQKAIEQQNKGADIDEQLIPKNQ